MLSECVNKESEIYFFLKYSFWLSLSICVNLENNLEKLWPSCRNRRLIQSGCVDVLFLHSIQAHFTSVILSLTISLSHGLEIFIEYLSRLSIFSILPFRVGFCNLIWFLIWSPFFYLSFFPDQSSKLYIIVIYLRMKYKMDLKRNLIK